MSDPEAGDSEGAENPEPEDDAHLSTINNTTPTGHQEESPPPANQENCNTDRVSTGACCQSSASDSHQNGAAPLSMNGDNLLTESDLDESQQYGGAPLCVDKENPLGESDQNESLQDGAVAPRLQENYENCAESDLDESQQQNGSVSVNSDENSTGCAGNLDHVTDEDSSEPQRSDDHSDQKGPDCPESDRLCSGGGDSVEAEGAYNGGLQPSDSSSTISQPTADCYQRNESADSHTVTRGSTTDSSDLEESPPEDERFASGSQNAAPSEDEHSHSETSMGNTENNAAPEDELFAVENSAAKEESGSPEDDRSAAETPVCVENGVSLQGELSARSALGPAEDGGSPEDERFVAGEESLTHGEDSAAPEDELSVAENSPTCEQNNDAAREEEGNASAGDAGPSQNESTQHVDAPCTETDYCTDPHASGILSQPPTQAETSRVSERDNDQIPECDREQSLCSSQHDSGSNALDTVSSSQGPLGSSKGTQQPADSCDPGPFSSQSQPLPNAKAPSKCENEQPEGVCDSSTSCDSRAALMQNNAPSHSVSASTYRQTLSSPSSTASAAKEINSANNRPSFMEDDSEDEDLLTELDAELTLRCSPRQQHREVQGEACTLSSGLNGMKDLDPQNRELCKRFEEQLLQLQETVLVREREINRLKDEKTRQRQVSRQIIDERDKLQAEIAAMKDRNADDLYLPQIKELENTISLQQEEIKQLKEKLTSHDSAAKRAINSLQSEMKARLDQISKMYEECCREKDGMVMKFAESETNTIEVKCIAEKMEARVRDLLKEKEFNANKTRAAMLEKQKNVAELQAKTKEFEAMKREAEKLKEEKNSMEYRIKWFQNKLKTELDAHKETKANLDKTTVKLKEAREETEMIRKDCQAIVKTYQESEEVRSNSLDKELKMKQTELMVKMKEKSDTEEIHEKTKRELESLKSRYKDTIEELKTLKDKVQCFEEERFQAEEVQSKYQAIIQNQKSDNAGLSKQLTDFQTLKEDFDRAQEMIKTLDSEVNQLKLANRDLQKDIEGCRARESKMLTLQSELSRTNALLRSENTNLNNQITTLSGETQKMSMDVQDLETRCRNLTDQLQEEQSKRGEETGTLSSQLATKTKESEDYKQKWEDEIDSSKTWKRKHASNVKDLTRQLQHAKKRLEAYENGSGGSGGDRDATSMGSRTNSNGSLNSMDTSAQHNHQGGQHNHHHHHPSTAASRGPSQEPEFPVITEQVEVDKQLLIERIVRLQRSLARKNEKLEFLEEHIQQLVAEIKKKNKIIQDYVVREESGTLASDTMDANKALLARKGGIMASVYSQHQQDGAMTLDLSLEINKKLQAVLEDTLLKNMTLKENLDTLGAEIARLSQENRRLQLRLQELEAH